MSISLSPRYSLLLVAAVLAAVCTVAPSAVTAEPIRVLAPAGAVGAVLFGIATHRPRRRSPWVLLAIAFGFLVSAQLAWTTMSSGDDVAYPSLADILHIGFWIVTLIAAVELSRQSPSEEDAFGGYEIGIIAIAVGVAVWIVVAEPYFSDSDVGVTAAAWAAGAPLIGGLAFAAAVRAAAASAYCSFAPVAVM